MSVRCRVSIGVALVSGPVAWALTQIAQPAWVEPNFALGWTRAFAAGVGSITGLVPFSVAQVGGLVVAAALIGGLGRRLRRPERRAWLVRGVPSVLAVASFGYAVFVGLWGLNYRREPLARTLHFSSERATADEVAALAEWAVDDMNERRQGVAEDAEGAFMLHAGVADALARGESLMAAAGETWPMLRGRYASPKPILGSALVSYLGIGGIYIPFTGEPHVNIAVPESSIPFNVCHELAHQRGVAREDEANFVAFLVGLERGDPDFAYSAALAGASYVIQAWREVDSDGAADVWARRSAAVERDLTVKRAWQTAHEGVAQAAGERVNHAYLRSNGVTDGHHSYGRVVDLMVAWRRP